MSAINARDVAAELGISYDLFRRTHKALEARGFPRPLPLVSRAKRGRPPMRWSLDAVRAWIREPRGPQHSAAANSNTPLAARDAGIARRLG